MIPGTARSFAALCFVVSGSAHAQSIRVEDAFALPSIQLQCEVPAPDGTVAPGQIALKFSGDTLGGRSIEARYDSTGAMRGLNVSVTRWITSTLSTETFIAGSNADGKLVGIHMWLDPKTGPPAQTVDLTPDQITLAKQLATWLWSRRCDKF
jgi:hypothetical protein